jgi:hypothetical protein
MYRPGNQRRRTNSPWSTWVRFARRTIPPSEIIQKSTNLSLPRKSEAGSLRPPPPSRERKSSTIGKPVTSPQGPQADRFARRPIPRTQIIKNRATCHYPASPKGGSLCAPARSHDRKSSKIGKPVTSPPGPQADRFARRPIPRSEIIKNRRTCHLPASPKGGSLCPSPHSAIGNHQKSAYLSPPRKVRRRIALPVAPFRDRKSSEIGKPVTPRKVRRRIALPVAPFRDRKSSEIGKPVTPRMPESGVGGPRSR